MKGLILHRSVLITMLKTGKYLIAMTKSIAIAMTISTSMTKSIAMTISITISMLPMDRL